MPFELFLLLLFLFLEGVGEACDNISFSVIFGLTTDYRATMYIPQ